MAFFFCLLLPLFSNPDIKDLETQLKGKTGKERLTILISHTRTLIKENPEQAVEYGKEALELMNRFSRWEQQVDLMNHICEAALILGDFAMVKTYASQGLDKAKQMGDVKDHADALSNLGEMYWYQSDFDTAIKYHQEAHNLYKQVKDTNGIASSFHGMARGYLRLGDYSKALEGVFHANRIYEEQQNLKGIGDLKNTIGHIYWLMEVG